jgi:hypothetical protein
MKKPLFIHIPKAGGSSIQNIIKKQNKDLTGCLHKSVTSYSKEYRNSCFVFSFVRNPHDRLLSAHKYLTCGYGNEGDTNFGKTLSPDFKYFVKNELQDNIDWLHFRPMISWLNDDVSFIGRFENLQEDFNIVCKEIGIPKQQLPHKNKSKHKHYTEYYDDETRQIVAEIYKQDLDLYNYSFIRG